MPKPLLVEVIGTLEKSGQLSPLVFSVGLKASSGPIYLGSRLEYSQMPDGSQNLIIRNGTVTRLHAIISLEADEWAIEDCGSDNGLIILDNDLNLLTQQTFQRIPAFKKYPIQKTSLLILGDVVVRILL